MDFPNAVTVPLEKVSQRTEKNKAMIFQGERKTTYTLWWTNIAMEIPLTTLW